MTLTGTRVVECPDGVADRNGFLGGSTQARIQPLVVVADPLANEGLDLLRPHARLEVVSGQLGRLAELLAKADALLVRSETRVTAALHRKLHTFWRICPRRFGLPG